MNPSGSTYVSFGMQSVDPSARSRIGCRPFLTYRISKRLQMAKDSQRSVPRILGVLNFSNVRKSSYHMGSLLVNYVTSQQLSTHLSSCELGLQAHPAWRSGVSNCGASRPYRIGTIPNLGWSLAWCPGDDLHSIGTRSSIRSVT
jgi:hypothetical protein